MTRPYTYHYTQPDEYHFSLDSIEFAQFVAQELGCQKNLTSWRALDLCAGCGVIGFELLWHLRELRQMDFLEVQDTYTDYFYQNAATVNRPELKLRWHLLNYDALLEESWKEKFDLVVSNPPYFRAEHGMLSPSRFKNRCRFFLDSSFAHFILALVNVLKKKEGKAYFLLRPSKQHGYNLLSDIEILLQNSAAIAKKVAEIRGTQVILIEKF